MSEATKLLKEIKDIAGQILASKSGYLVPTRSQPYTMNLGINGSQKAQAKKNRIAITFWPLSDNADAVFRVQTDSGFFDVYPGDSLNISPPVGYYDYTEYQVTAIGTGAHSIRIIELISNE